MDLRIKNMVCPRCIEAVKQSLESLTIPYKSIELGSITFFVPISESQKNLLSLSLEEKGFELLEDKNTALVSQIKSLIIEQIHHSDQNLGENYSTFLSEKLQQDYSSISRLFSQHEGLTIEKFITKQKIERIKELLFNDQLSLSQIAFDLNYSSVAYLSAQFKKETGMTPSEFKKNHLSERKSLDQL